MPVSPHDSTVSMTVRTSETLGHETTTKVSGTDVAFDDISILERPFISAPVEELRMLLKAQQRLCEKDFTFCIHALEVTINRQKDKQNGDIIDEITDQRNLIHSRLLLMREKFASLLNQTSSYLDATKARTDHLSELQPTKYDPEIFKEWCNIRLYRMLADYFFRQEYLSAATELVQGRHIEVRAKCII